MDCNGCGTAVTDNNYLKCNACRTIFCLECMNIKASTLSRKDLASLKCPSCTNVSRRRTDRPRSSDSSFTSPRNIKEVSETLTLNSLSQILDDKLSANSTFVNELREVLKKDLESIVVSKLKTLTEELKRDFQATTNFLTSELADVRAKLEEKSNEITILDKEQHRLQEEVKVLQDKINTADKLSRERNIELQCVPEERNENVVTLFQNLCKTINVNIPENDIHACRRVAKVNHTSKRPRNIVVTLSSVRLRDTVLSATHRFNKGNRVKLNTEHFGIKGDINRVYATEHLSPEHKQLHAAARQTARNKNFKFVWVRYNNIYLRKDESTNPILIKNLDSLSKIN